jgi:hypothetical protein
MPIDNMHYYDEDGKEIEVDTGMFDEEYTYDNCTVQVLRNSITGQISIGWKLNGEVKKNDA